MLGKLEPSFLTLDVLDNLVEKIPVLLTGRRSLVFFCNLVCCYMFNANFMDTCLRNCELLVLGQGLNTKFPQLVVC